MDAREFLDTFGGEEAERVAAKAKTNLAYFKQIAYGHRRPSVELAQLLIVASDGRLDFHGLLTGKKPSADSDPPKPANARATA